MDPTSWIHTHGRVLRVIITVGCDLAIGHDYIIVAAHMARVILQGYITVAPDRATVRFEDVIVFANCFLQGIRVACIKFHLEDRIGAIVAALQLIVCTPAVVMLTSAIRIIVRIHTWHTETG